MDNESGTKTAAAATAAPKKEEQKPSEVSTKTIVNDALNVKTNDADKIVCADTKNSDELKKMNSLLSDLEGDTNEGVKKASETVTTTTVTVNIKQTKIAMEDSAKKSITEKTEQIVSSVSGAAALTVASEKLDGIAAAKANKTDEMQSIEDVEMAELADDVEMKDITSHVTGNGETKTAEADSANVLSTVATTSNEAEQKIDDVEKNISNLFNGDDSAVSVVELHSEGCKKSETSQKTDATSSTNDNANNVAANNAKETPPDKDNNDLVSILAGNDKPEEKSFTEKISSSSSSSSIGKGVEKAGKAVAKTKATGNSIEKKLLANVIGKSVTSTPSSSTIQTVFNSTPIQKQFEISSENVSTISESTTDSEHCIGDKSIRQEIISSHSSTINKSSDLSSSGAVTGSESSDQTSSDNLKRFAKVIRKFNGLTDETDASSGQESSPAQQSANKTDASATKEIDSTGKTTHSSTTVVSTTSAENVIYDINICYDNKELIYFGIEKQDLNKSHDKTDLASEKVSSVGSVNSISESFSLPTRCATVTSTNSTLSSSSSSVSDAHKEISSVAANQLKKTKHEIKGTLALCQFMVDHFQKLGSKFTDSIDVAKARRGQESTPTVSTTGKRKGTTASATTPTITPSSTTSGNKRKRGSIQTPPGNVSIVDADDETPKSAAKKPKKSVEAVAAAVSNYPEKAVLARWVDKKFYAGRVIEQKPNNKFVVLFEDGAKKVLPEEHIVFGEENILPLTNESVHALVKGDTYEPGIVQSVKTKDDAVYYTVLCESTTVTVTASDIYLEDDQAKVILSKQTPTAAKQPEAGFSGGINTRKDRRQKRTECRQVQWFSESDVSDIVESDSTPASPVTVLEAVDGVQPELQHTQKESELVRICYLMEQFGDNFKKMNLDNILGPIITSNIFRNKSFLLTCTIPIKSVNGTTNERQNVNNNGYDLSNRNMTFSTIPFFKDHLKQQIESAGGIVYNNFENVPTNKYRTCCLLAPFPCITAKYVQCLAANITAVSHEWIVECCQSNKLVSKDEYILPSGWSILENSYKPWTIGRAQRKNTFSKTTIILTCQQSDFVEFWSRVCKSGGAKIRIVKSVNDITATTKGYILLDDEFPAEYQSRAERFRIPIVSTVWVIQSLIVGKVCDPMAHPKLTQLYEDDYF